MLKWSYIDIGNLYATIIEDCCDDGKEVDELVKVFKSFISDEISRFETDLYYQNPDYLECSLNAKELFMILSCLKHSHRTQRFGTNI